MFVRNVSNPAQNPTAWPAIINLSEMRNARTFLKSTLATHSVTEQSPVTGERARVD